MFPRGLPGLALVLLRASVAIALLLECYAYRQGLSIWIQGLAMVIAVALCVGYLTPVVALAGLIFHALIWSGMGAGSAIVAAVVILDAAALAFLGPGGYSIDSYRYGRRIVVL
jgi:putative oxidoreductase